MDFLTHFFLLLFVILFQIGFTQVDFLPETIDDQIEIGYGLTIGDVDGDQKPDILLADKKAFVWYRNPDWKRHVIVKNLTERDNVCIAARDIDNDGIVEIAVGAQWNPGETVDEAQSGSVHYLVRPSGDDGQWSAIQLPHEPTVHRMRWIKTSDGFQLVVVPLHGRNNKQGKGRGVRIYSYMKPIDPTAKWTQILVDSTMHITHNFDIVKQGDKEMLLISGREGAKFFEYRSAGWHPILDGSELIGRELGFGEIRKGQNFIVGVQPFHGNELVLYRRGVEKRVLTDQLKQGHALACADLIGLGQDQIVVGWRNKNDMDQMGIKLFIPTEKDWSLWKEIWIDENDMACEDLKVYDLDGDGKLDIIASGRSTKNLKVFWNRN